VDGMNPYALLPLIAFLANIFLGFYILRRNARDSISILYSFITFSWAVWAFGDFLVYTAQSAEAALRSEIFSTVGAALNPIFVITFFLKFTQQKLANKLSYILCLPSLFFILILFTTDLISIAASESWFGYYILRGSLYIPFILYIVTYTTAGLFVIIRHYLKSGLGKEKINIKLLIIAVGLPLVGGLLSQVLPEALGFEFMRMTTPLTVISAIIIAYAISKHGLIKVTPGAVADRILETMTDYIIVADNDRKIRLANTSILTMLGKKREEVLGKPISVLQLNLEDLFRLLKNNDSVKGYEIGAIDKNKKPVTLSINASVMKDKIGSRIGFVLDMRDVSYVKDLIKGIEKSKKELEESKKTMEDKVQEIERFNRLAIGRELKMLELKKKIKELQKK
jgi:PAS domain S-box-containing protein